MLNREKVLKIFGPPGFLSNVRGKLSGYTWNLTSGYPFSVLAAEVHPDRIHFQIYLCQERFAPGEEREESFNGVLDEDSHIQIRATHLDHSIPCLAFVLQERFHINVHKERLAQMGLPIGPWLKELKEAIWRGEGRDFRLKVPLIGQGGVQEKEVSLAVLKESLTITARPKNRLCGGLPFQPGE